MTATAGARKKGHRHHSSQPSPEQLQRDHDRLIRENEELRRKIAERDKEIAERDQQIADAQKQIADAEKQIADAEKQIADAEKQIADLEHQLALRQQNSTNSSKPPSSDGLAGEPRKRGSREKKSGRKPGGQAGHRGAHRPLEPVERVNEIRTVLPAQCQGCGHALPTSIDQVKTSGEVQRHQVTELPPVQPHIIEYQCHEVVCPECGKSTRSKLPPEASRHFGPQLTALIAYLTVCCRMPRRAVEALLEQVLGIQISLGSIQNCWEESSQAVATPVQKAEQNLKAEPVVNADETGWRNNGAKRYLWVFVAARYVVYTVAATRGSEVLVQLLGPVFQGILCSDRFSAYVKYHQGKAQFCWAHLKRNLLGAAEFTKHTEVDHFCRDALAQHARLFRLWHKFRGGLMDRQQLKLRSIPIQKKLFELAENHLDSSHREIRNLATAIFEHNGRLFTFLEAEGVEPTNNIAERKLRPPVQWRKICFGNRSEAGGLATGRLLTVAGTCQMQGVNILVYLASAIAAHRRRQPAPSLLAK